MSAEWRNKMRSCKNKNIPAAAKILTEKNSDQKLEKISGPKPTTIISITSYFPFLVAINISNAIIFLLFILYIFGNLRSWFWGVGEILFLFKQRLIAGASG